MHLVQMNHHKQATYSTDLKNIGFDIYYKRGVIGVVVTGTITLLE